MTKRKKPFLTPPRVIAASVVITVLICLATWLFLSDKNVAVLNPMGIIAKQQVSLMLFTLALSVVVVIPVFAMLGIIAWKYREGNEKAIYDPNHEGSKWLEVLWWGIPIVIIGILSVVTWVSTHQLDPYKTIASSKPALRVQVVSLPWKWLFLYPDYGIASLNELRMPVGTTVDFDITADSPMSAFWIPNLGTQTYAMNGMSSKLSLRADKEGSFRGSNSNISGKGYADMHFQAIAMKDQDVFDAWAHAVKADKTKPSLTPEVYSRLVEPSKKDPVTYYRSFDAKLYSEVIQKYMPSHDEHGGNE